MFTNSDAEMSTTYKFFAARRSSAASASQLFDAAPAGGSLYRGGSWRASVHAGVLASVSRSQSEKSELNSKNKIFTLAEARSSRSNCFKMKQCLLFPTSCRDERGQCYETCIRRTTCYRFVNNVQLDISIQNVAH